uniref:Secreted protein n=1 Tax=Steinernema glaseri TaxID=37863 RepID=A0A1I7YX16_9BILA
MAYGVAFDFGVRWLPTPKCFLVLYYTVALNKPDIGGGVVSRSHSRKMKAGHKKTRLRSSFRIDKMRNTEASGTIVVP